MVVINKGGWLEINKDGKKSFFQIQSLDIAVIEEVLYIFHKGTRDIELRESIGNIDCPGGDIQGKIDFLGTLLSDNIETVTELKAIRDAVSSPAPAEVPISVTLNRAPIAIPANTWVEIVPSLSIQSDGFYEIEVLVTLSRNAVIGLTTVRLLINGIEPKRPLRLTTDSTAARSTVSSVAGRTYTELRAGDVIALQVTSNSNATISIPSTPTNGTSALWLKKM